MPGNRTAHYRLLRRPVPPRTIPRRVVYGLLFNRFVGEGFHVLDEPESALSPQRQLSVLTRMHDLVQHNSQFIIATHSPILMSHPNATIYNLTSKGIEQIDYYQTEHYQVTRDFLVSPQRMLDRLWTHRPRHRNAAPKKPGRAR